MTSDKSPGLLRRLETFYRHCLGNSRADGGERESRNLPGFPIGKVHRKSQTSELQCVTAKKKLSRGREGRGEGKKERKIWGVTFKTLKDGKEAFERESSDQKCTSS